MSSPGGGSHGHGPGAVRPTNGIGTSGRVELEQVVGRVGLHRDDRAETRRRHGRRPRSRLSCVSPERVVVGLDGSAWSVAAQRLATSTSATPRSGRPSKTNRRGSGNNLVIPVSYRFAKLRFANSGLPKCALPCSAFILGSARPRLGRVILAPAL